MAAAVFSLRGCRSCTLSFGSFDLELEVGNLFERFLDVLADDGFAGSRVILYRDERRGVAGNREQPPLHGGVYGDAGRLDVVRWYKTPAELCVLEFVLVCLRGGEPRPFRHDVGAPVI